MWPGATVVLNTGDRLVLFDTGMHQPGALGQHRVGTDAGADAWITGIRREQALTRADAKRVEWSERYGVWKIQPVVDWDAKRVQAYIHVNEIPYNPLHDAGYPSIGCIPCTRPVVEGDDPVGRLERPAILDREHDGENGRKALRYRRHRHGGHPAIARVDDSFPEIQGVGGHGTSRREKYHDCRTTYNRKTL